MITWRTGLSAQERARITDIITAATALDGVAPVGDQVLRELGRDDTRHLLARDGDTIVGYLNLTRQGERGDGDSSGMAEAVVHPDARRRGIGTELIRTGLAEGGPQTRIWAHGDLAPARAVAAALGLASVRELLQMRRPLSGLPSGASEARDQSAVAGTHLVRTYSGPEDDAELLRVNNAAFSWHPEQGGWTEADIDERRSEKWFDAEGLFLAFDVQCDFGLRAQPPGEVMQPQQSQLGTETAALRSGIDADDIHLAEILRMDLRPMKTQ